MRKNRVKHIETGILGTAKAEDDHGNVAVEWDNRTIVTTPREELEWLEDEVSSEAPADMYALGGAEYPLGAPQRGRRGPG